MKAVYKFGRYELNAATRQLLVEGQPAAVGSRAFDVLLALVERRERLVTKDELLELAWPGLVVEENNLQVQISALRKLLGPRAIATIAGRGYRFALVLDAAAGAASAVAPITATPAQAPARTATPVPGRGESMFTLRPAATRIRRGIWCIAFACASVLVHAATPEEELIPRRAFFGDPVGAGVSVSPDGKNLAWLAPRNGVMNIWIAPVARPHAGRPLTAETSRPIRDYTWVPASDQILYVRYDPYRQRHSLLGRPIMGGKAVIYASSEKAPPQIVATTPLVRDSILVALSDRDPNFPDVYRLNLRSRELALVRQNEGWKDWLVDRQLNLRGGLKHDGAGGFDVLRFDGGESIRIAHIAPEDAFYRQSEFDADGKTLFILSSRNRSKRALDAVDFATGASRLIGEHDRADAVFFLAHPTTGKPNAFVANYRRQEWTALGESLKADFALLADRFADGFLVLSQSDDDRFWTLRVNELSQGYYLYDRRNRKLVQLLRRLPALANRRPAPTHPVEITARDGLTLVAYLTLPSGRDGTSKAVPDHPLPLVLSVSDHIWSRFYYGPEPRFQWLANRGYAVLALNQRGALGLGKAFHTAGDRETAGKRLNDVIDAVNWALREQIAPADKIAMLGVGFGGYVALMALASAPEAFACGVNMRGGASLATAIESSKEPFLTALFHAKLGDPRTEEGRRKLLVESPISQAGNMRRPLLITNPGRAPFIKQSETEEIVAALQAENIPVTYAHFGDEAGLEIRFENRLSEYALVEAFLSRCLGGRYEPIGKDLRGSSIEIKAGADHVPGLSQALSESTKAQPPQ